MKVLYVCFEALPPGGAAFRHMTGIVYGIERRGHEVLMAAPSDSRIGRVARLRAVTQKALSLIGNVDVVYIRMHPASAKVVVASRRIGLPVVLEINGPPADTIIAHPILTPFYPALAFSWRHQVRRATATISVTPQLQGRARSMNPRRPHFYVTNGADPVEVPLRASKDRRLYVVFCGSLALWQGLETLIAAAESKYWPPGVDLVIVGDGKMAPEVAAAASKIEHLVWVGHQSHNQVTEWLQGAAASLIPKNNRGRRNKWGLAPIKLFESLQCGVPIIATDFEPMTSIIREMDAGLIISPESPEELCAAVESICSTQEKWINLKAKIRAAATACHTWDARANDTLQILQKQVESQ